MREIPTQGNLFQFGARWPRVFFTMTSRRRAFSGRLACVHCVPRDDPIGNRMPAAVGASDPTDHSPRRECPYHPTPPPERRPKLSYIFIVFSATSSHV